MPKQEFFKSEDTSSVGEIVYDEAEKKVVSEKLSGDTTHTHTHTLSLSLAMSTIITH